MVKTSCLNDGTMTCGYQLRVKSQSEIIQVHILVTAFSQRLDAIKSYIYMQYLIKFYV